MLCMQAPSKRRPKEAPPSIQVEKIETKVKEEKVEKKEEEEKSEEGKVEKETCREEEEAATKEAATKQAATKDTATQEAAMMKEREETQSQQLNGQTEMNVVRESEDAVNLTQINDVKISATYSTDADSSDAVKCSQMQPDAGKQTEEQQETSKVASLVRRFENL